MKQLGSRTRARIAINKLVYVAGIDRKGHSHRAVGSSSATFFTPPQAGFTCGCSKGGAVVERGCGQLCSSVGLLPPRSALCGGELPNALWRVLK